VVGVDTHRDVHVAVALSGVGANLAHDLGPDPGGRLLGAPSVGASTGAGSCVRDRRDEGATGRGSRGGSPRTARPCSRWTDPIAGPGHGTARSDPLDAEVAARAVLSGKATGVPKSGLGAVEMIRALRVARRSAMKARTQAANQLVALVLTAPPEIREVLRG
jgi:transposase